jgi:hypothetical protein
MVSAALVGRCLTTRCSMHMNGLVEHHLCVRGRIGPCRRFAPRRAAPFYPRPRRASERGSFRVPASRTGLVVALEVVFPISRGHGGITFTHIAPDIVPRTSN